MAGYWTVPVDVQENRDQLAQWAKEALKAAPGKPRRRSGSERSARRKRK
jgi:TfoX/Sxy family transcriptional regulator of competence genes